MSKILTKTNALSGNQELIDKPEHSQLTSKICRLSAVACNKWENENFEIEKSAQESQNNLKALGVAGGLQEMLAAQMLSIHRLQQISMAMAIETKYEDTKQYFTNTGIKLANTFVQQANLLSRLQGSGGQKIVIERVDVHHGGQAIVGSVNGDPPL